MAIPTSLALSLVDVAARRTDVEAVALARVDLGSFLVEAEALHPARILVDPGIFDAVGCNPVEGAPDVEKECAVLGGEAGDGVRADDPALQCVADLRPRRSAVKRPCGWT